MAPANPQVGTQAAPVSGVCRQCGRPRPAGYAVTCGRSECQEQDYLDNKARYSRRRPGQTTCGVCGKPMPRRSSLTFHAHTACLTGGTR